MQEFKSFITLDWLSITYYISRLSLFENSFIPNNFFPYVWEDAGETKIYKKRFLIFNEKKQKVLTILAEPKSEIINNNFILIEFSNITFYSNEWIYLLKNLNKFADGYIYSISRLDIACDFQYWYNEDNILSYAENLVNLLDCCYFYIKGKKKGSSFYEYVETNNIIKKKIIQLNFGSKSSYFKWKLYNKSKEIKEESHKYYISDIWKKIGFDDKDVYRLEVSLTDCSSYQILDKNGLNYLIFDLSSDYPLNYIELFKKLQTTKFCVKRNNGNKNVSRNDTINIFNYNESFLSIERKPITYFSELDKIKKYITTSINFINKADEINGILEANEGIANAIKSLLNTFYLKEWFYEKFGIIYGINN